MKCLMELDSPKFGLTWAEKLAYLTFKFADASEKSRMPVTHHFEPGMYIREMIIAPETLFIGRPHLMGHRCELISGKILLITEDAKTHMEAPAELWSKPNYQMCLYAKTEVIGRTYHPIPDTAEWRISTADFEQKIFGPLDAMMALGEQVRRKIHAIEGKTL